MELSDIGSDERELYRWQLDALVSWLRCGRRGVIEAVTGSGKTDVAIAAVSDALQRGRFVLVVVPSRVLMEQWHGRLQTALPGIRIGRLGDSGKDTADSCDILVTTRHSAAAYKPVPPGKRGGLLIADECHGLGGGILRRALLKQYDERLGLTATLERSDDAVNELLLPYFGGICHRYGFEQAIADGVCARPRVAFVGVELSADERAEYLETEQKLVNARHHLRLVHGMPVEPFGDFLAAVAHLAERDAGADGRAAREYLDAFSKRRQIVAQTIGKYELLGSLAPAIKNADGALLFTETVRAANHAINRLDPLVSIDLITGSTARGQRREILDDLRVRRLDAVAAPRVLDEGIDVPDANLGIVMSASRTRRQMIQRMGRILRRKRPGVAARFVIMFAKDTLEDPAFRMERDGFLDEIERISEATRVFDRAQFADLDAFLAEPGPETVPEPARLQPYEAAFEATGTELGRVPTDDAVDALAETLGVEAAYAFVSFARRDQSEARRAVAVRRLGDRLPQPDRTAKPYIELELTNLPEIVKPRVKPKRMSTGQAPIEIARIGNAWRISCTGCGEASPLVQFRWQALDQTVACRCN
ncbi:MAG TPA: DEAD/DEAH box helicase [Acidimicrobiia bacterium]|jgi:superfamily II DNA or RNA helicase|nr:DEAD/DEAH box helicase [Acidimicrobiia bacterium]